MTDVWEVHGALVALVWAWAAIMIMQTMRAMSRGAFFHMIPETLAMAVLHAALSTLAVFALRPWLQSTQWPSLWAPRLLLTLTHVAILILSGLAALMASDFLRSLY